MALNSVPVFWDKTTSDDLTSAFQIFFTMLPIPAQTARCSAPSAEAVLARGTGSWERLWQKLTAFSNQE